MAQPIGSNLGGGGKVDPFVVFGTIGTKEQENENDPVKAAAKARQYAKGLDADKHVSSLDPVTIKQ